MSTTSLKLPEEVKNLANAAAERQGITPHAFMVDAIRNAALLAEKRAGFVADAVAARDEFTRNGKGHAASEGHAYVRARARGNSTPKPKLKTWRS